MREGSRHDCHGEAEEAHLHAKDGDIVATLQAPSGGGTAGIGRNDIPILGRVGAYAEDVLEAKSWLLAAWAKGEQPLRAPGAPHGEGKRRRDASHRPGTKKLTHGAAPWQPYDIGAPWTPERRWRGIWDEAIVIKLSKLLGEPVRFRRSDLWQHYVFLIPS
jgi:hypothetical protein